MVDIKKVPKKKVKPARKPPAQGVDWENIKLKWLQKNLEYERDEIYTLKELAEDHKLAIGTVRNKASDQKWYMALDLAVAAREQSVVENLVEFEAEAEAIVRTRQASAARAVGSRIVSELMTRNFKSAKISELLSGLTAMMEQERKAYGYAQQFHFHVEDTREAGFETVRENMEKHDHITKQVNELADFLASLPTDMGMKDIEGEATTVDDDNSTPE